MFNNLVYKYIDALKIEDIENFLKKQGICLKKIESEIIYKEIKSHTNDVLRQPEEALSKIKDKLENTTYLKLHELIKSYKKKYPDYLSYL